jgi:phosphoenolpyruvate carboxylase
MSKAWPVDARLDFDSMRNAKHAAIDLLRAGYKRVRIESELVPTAIAVVELVLTADSLSSMRVTLAEFARVREGEMVRYVVGASPSVNVPWKTTPTDEAAADQCQQPDQQLVDMLFAWDLDMNKPVALITAVGFHSEAEALEAAVAFIDADYREVHLVQADVGPIVEVVTHMTPKVKEIHDFRVKMTKLAASRIGSWLGTHVVARPPKIADKQ